MERRTRRSVVDGNAVRRQFLRQRPTRSRDAEPAKSLYAARRERWGVRYDGVRSGVDHVAGRMGRMDDAFA